MSAFKDCALSAALGLSSFCLAMPASAYDCDPTSYYAGAAQADITGPIVGVGMMGYADLAQTNQGLHMRLRARALVVTDTCSDKSVAVVIDDIAMIFGGVKREVIARLDRLLPGVFNYENVLLSATHTHAGPGGFSNYTLYNITTFGASPNNFEAIVAGTTEAILKAYHRREKAYFAVNQGDLMGTQFNRSPDAYRNNPEAERARYASEVDPQITLLSVVSAEGRPMAAFNWYPVHGVSLPSKNKLVSGDNKGMAAYLFERKMGVTYQRDGEFVAGFVQAHAGDVSPYPLTRAEQDATDGFDRNFDAGAKQARKALELFHSANQLVYGAVDYTHRFEALAHRQSSGGHTLCHAGLGVSFAAGTENGKPFPFFQEGSIYGLSWPRITLMPEEQACHAEKVLLLPTGLLRPSTWTAEIAPFQLVRIGNLAMIATPFEITTMAGRRLKETVLAELKPLGVQYVVIAGLANEYLHYVTTREEYAKQSYEGGSTLFGPWSLEVYTDLFVDLSRELREAIRQPGGLQPPLLPFDLVVQEPSPVFDSIPRGRQFGDIVVAPEREYLQGVPVNATFFGGHPARGTGEASSYLTVEFWQDGEWIAQYFDWDPETQLHWQKAGIYGSRIHIRWETDATTRAGTYRICHAGQHKRLFSDVLQPYSGCTEGFVVKAKRGG